MCRDRLPPLSVYIHWPWCLRRCSYCDFNAYPMGGETLVEPFVGGVEAELSRVCRWFNEQRALLGSTAAPPAVSVFFGGGTPSLLPAAAVQRILEAVGEQIGLAWDVEVTLEANPGARERGEWCDYRAAGINRLSLGVQSLDDHLLRRLGRVHDSRAALSALEQAHAAGLTRVNVDLMYALPGQTQSSAQADVTRLVNLGVKHISHYQLTIESGTPIAQNPPADLPDEQAQAQMESACREQMAAAGLKRYEVSAFAGPGQQCVHNLNYWSYGDFLGIGPGAHGKLTLAPGKIVRTEAVASPQQWLRSAGTESADARDWQLSRDEVVFELFANGLRLVDGIAPCEAQANSGISWTELEDCVGQLIKDGWLEWRAGRLRAADGAFEMLDSALEFLLPAS
ncbi:radical SAM family heme chaperone HemW [Halorhodospira halochloris]|uniref:radical SAM family heme chaperone HemW n=1 Tax=Halorhodospira halochloris TaxID=1052 RepID=UPI001EE81429|nr:radical SAM family heme chaperone HemW [Halorhodospira halochloris]MCG5529403.1 radical SAM family heme chaperone HemW [Halorhodospira halochloris]